MIYAITYTSHVNGKSIKRTIELDVQDTNMDDTPYLLTEFAREICHRDIIVNNVICTGEE